MNRHSLGFTQREEVRRQCPICGGIDQMREPNSCLFCEEIAHSVRAMNAVLDGEIVCLDPDGRSNFHKKLV